MPLSNGKFLAFSREKTKEKLGSISGKRKDAPRPVPRKGDIIEWQQWCFFVELQRNFTVCRAFPLVSIHLKIHRKWKQILYAHFTDGDETQLQRLAQDHVVSKWKNHAKNLVSWYLLHDSFLFTGWFLVQWWDNCLDLMEADNDWASQWTRH